MKYLVNNGVSVVAQTEREAIDYKEKGFKEVDESGNPVGEGQTAGELSALKRVAELEEMNKALVAQNEALTAQVEESVKSKK